MFSNTNIFKTNLVKLLTIITRLLVLSVGIPETIAIGILVLSFNIYLLTPVLACLIILIFPFGVLSSIKNLYIYCLLLSFATFSLIITIWLNTSFNLLYEFLFSFGRSLLLVANLYFVYMYLDHRRDPNRVNPFIEKKAFKFLLKISAVVIIIISMIVLYLIIDIRMTPRGQQYTNMPLNIPQAEAEFTSQALNSNYKLESNIYFDPKNRYPLYIKIKRSSIDKDEFIELYENGQKIYRVEFNKKELKSISVFDKDGTMHQESSKPSNSYNRYGRNPYGKFTEISWKNQSRDFLTRLDLFMDYHLNLSAWRAGKQVEGIEEFEIEINKTINYPIKPRYVLLPFLRTSQHWELTLKDSKGEIPLIKNILIWY